MLAYIGEQHGLAGDGSALQRAKVVEFMCGLDDLRSTYTKAVYGGGFTDDVALAKALLEDVTGSALFGEQGRLARINAVLAMKRAAENTPEGTPVFAVGTALTVADISLATLLDDLLIILPQATHFPELKLVHEHVMQLPAVAAYVKSAPANREQVNGNVLGSGKTAVVCE
jgi:glutathione S-transferase